MAPRIRSLGCAGGPPGPTPRLTAVVVVVALSAGCGASPAYQADATVPGPDATATVDDAAVDAVASGPDASLPPDCTTGDACDDGDACTAGETWSAACTCDGGAPVVCDDHDACTVDTCSVAGCSFGSLPEGTPCGDGQTCQGGVCQEASCLPPAGPPPSTTRGTSGALLLRGTVVTPTIAFAGEVLVQGDTITCVDLSCAAHPGAAGASVVDTAGLIFPGLIDSHNHILFDIFDETDWSPTRSYGNHNQWTSEPRYQALVDAKQYLNGEGSSVELGCEMNKYGELKALVAGTTSVVGAANPTNKACYGSLARTIDQTPNDLGDDPIQVATLFPNATSANGVCRNLASGATDAYVIHIAEGVDGTALREFATLGTVTETPECLYAPQTTIVHGTALEAAQWIRMGAAGMSLVWSPRSNIFLYGGGVDLTATADIPLARHHGINVALAPDWSIGGSHNLLDELRFADHVDNSVWGDVLSPYDLVQMVTVNAAHALGLGTVLGSIEVGKKADLMVVAGDPGAPWASLLAAHPRDVRLVLVGGVVLYGDAALEPIAPASPGCEALDVCCAGKFLCVAEAAGTATNKFGQTYGEIVDALTSGLAGYDGLDLSPYDFAPVTPLVDCAE